jgi:LuxR family maltose regulon positive regulatory protein
MGMELPLLSTKFSIPLINAEFISRPRLVERLNESTHGPLTVLAAPAGFGKTSLLAEWLRQSKLALAWLTLDAEDNERPRFARCLVHALQTASPGLGEEALEYFISAKNGGTELALTVLINEIAARPVELVLVLDEYHLVEEPAIHRSLNYLLTHRPHNLHLVVASRSEPALDLAFLRAKGWVVEFGPEDLRFASEEVDQFLSQTMRLSLAPATVRELEQRTEGWVAGLQLAALSLRHRTDPLAAPAGRPHYLIEFLAEKVLNRQPEDVRHFLLRSAILEALSGPLCEAVIAPEAPPGWGKTMLERLYRAQLFLTPLDEQHTWYRYHRQVAEFLLQVALDTCPDEVPELHCRAARWFEAQGRLDDAFRHALAAGDPEWAASLMEPYGRALTGTGEAETLTRRIGQLPATVVRQRPALGLAYAWSLVQAFQLDAARLWLDDIDQALADPAFDWAGKARPTGPELAVCRSTLAIFSGDMQTAVALMRTILEEPPTGDPLLDSIAGLDRGLMAIMQGDTAQAIEALRAATRTARQNQYPLVQLVITCQLAEMQALQGQLTQALTTLEKARLYTQGPGGSPLPLAGIVDITTGEILRERDQLKEARLALERGIRLTHTWWSLSGLSGLVSLARVLQSQGDPAGAQAVTTEAARMALSREASPWDEVFVSAYGAWLALQRGDLPAAVQWRQKSGLLDAPNALDRERYPYHVYEYLVLTEARYRCALGQDTGEERELQGSLALLQSVLPEAERFRRVTSVIQIHVLEALALYELGEAEQAVQRLASALALGEPEGYRRIFLDEGRVMAALLARCQARKPEPGVYLPTPGYVQSLLEVAQREAGIMVTEAPGGRPEQPGTAAPARQSAGPATTPFAMPRGQARTPEGLPVSLSGREVEVLELIAAGRSNQEISAELFLALNTVKRHVYNIFTKLDVKNRTQAVTRARQLRLIP